MSLTRTLVVELRDAIQLMAEPADTPLTVKCAPYPGCILCADGTRRDILAADKATGHAIGADLAVIIDEAGLVQENQLNCGIRWRAIRARRSAALYQHWRRCADFRPTRVAV